MKSKINNKKCLISLALIIFMVAPMFMSIVRADPSAAGTFSAVLNGTTSTNSISYPASPSPIGQTFKIDVRIDGAANVWGWSIPTVTWNPAVLNLTKVQEGSWLANNAPGGDATSFAGNSGSLIDNTVGKLNGGMSEAISGADQSVDSSGVVATLTFKVVGYGNSQITISGGYLHTTSDAADPKIYVACNSASVTVEQPRASINLYAHGTTNPNIGYPSLNNPINATFQVDLYINGATGVWGWNTGLTWDHSVLQLTNIAEGTYLSSTGATAFVSGYINNNLGKVEGGLNDAYTSYMTASATSGVLATLTFKIISYQPSASINLTSGTPATLLDASYPHNAITPVDLYNASYSWTPATATGPQAVITTTGSPFGSGSNQTITLMPITFDGSYSVAGTDTIPPYENCPITSYSWSIRLVDGTIVTSNASTVDLTAAQVGTNPGNIVATLTVTAPDSDGISAGTYNPWNTTTFTLQVIPPLPDGWNNWTNGALDIWTQNGGQGWNQSSNSFGPQQQVNITAKVTYNGAPVVGKQVAFNIYLNGSYLDARTAITDSNGFAYVTYRLPWQDSNPSSYFGIVTIQAAVDVSEVHLNDTCRFYYGYSLNLQSVQITNGISDSHNVGPVFFRNYAGLNTLTLRATVDSTNWTSESFYLTITIYDNNSVPVTYTILPETALPATEGVAGSHNTQTYDITCTIPTWAFVGSATVYVNLYNGNPTQNALPLSPEQSAKLYIYMGQ